ncbi:MAG: succinate dehydrogenase, cytochrome b556 subunit [Alphaproteobacteria bacterium]|nr:succinate dehydrogenase, cytochrome b556 subunit [Alphaproteobacteria bacterium]MBU1514707.1 succinate dehydrogenase, cytochrome b556 subunit [Alphaproteobacteria bacterium]MBU2093566.1 succinate dehydrogenase, cytochrome b556 subunit [Alphaproteobacteria bacterium]MBU2149480.1 succinate dehydrogenase, cytochrome b556 subunit [Alphaproteobacteria bacterium]MBU2305477.1 succinate dehydrogenase, cytochrome b556 subunit [Alphaproteobacteria bacterium]
MTNVPRGPADRPMSPHLQVWRWHITMATSILHRASIFALYLGLLLLAGWLVALAAGAEASDAYSAVIGSPLGLLVLFGISVMLFFNMAYNIRQAFWDLGHGFELKTAEATAWASIAFGIVAAVALWAGLAVRGVL